MGHSEFLNTHAEVIGNQIIFFLRTLDFLLNLILLSQHIWAHLRMPWRYWLVSGFCELRFKIKKSWILKEGRKSTQRVKQAHTNREDTAGKARRSIWSRVWGEWTLLLGTSRSSLICRLASITPIPSSSPLKSTKPSTLSTQADSLPLILKADCALCRLPSGHSLLSLQIRSCS